MKETAKLGYDVIIVGAGPAGLCAAMYAGRGMLKALTIERGAPGGELLNTDLIEDYIGFESIKGWELAQKMAEHAKKFGAEIVTDTVEQVRKADDGWFDVATARGKTYRAPAVILTAGGTPVKLGVPGEKEYAGKGVSYCAVCDGAFFKGEVLAVVGGGDAAVEEADYLTRYASKVYIVHRRDRLRASKILQERAFANPKIEMIWNKHVLEIKGTERGIHHLELLDTVTREHSNLLVGGAFIFIGFRPNTDLVEGHVKHDAGCYFVTDDATAECAIIDPGEEAGLIAYKLQAEAVRPVGIWLTHAHIDHVLGVPRLKADTGAPRHLHPADRVLYDHVLEQGLAFGMRAERLPAPDRELAHDDVLWVGGLEFRVRHAPGHSPGSVVFEGQGAVFGGDVLFQGSIGRTDLPGGDFDTLLKSIERELLTLPDSTIVYSGHGPETTVGRERRANPFLTGAYRLG